MRANMPMTKSRASCARGCAVAHRGQRARRDARTCASFFDKIKDVWQRSQFENWAPKSSRAWRLRQTPREMGQDAGLDFADALEQRMARLSEDAQSVRPAERPTESFTNAGDDNVAAALSKRLAASTDADDDIDSVPVDRDAPLTPQELVDLVVRKYKNKYDMTIARRNWMGKDFVSLNIMWVHLEQRSFPMSEEDYMDKMDGICMLLNIWSKQGDVRTFLQAPAKSKNGMPGRPIVGTAVSVQLDLPPGVVSEWIGNRMG